MKTNTSRYSKGFSLVETLVGLSLLSLAVLANVAITDLVNQQTKYETSHSYLNGLYSNLNRELISADGCNFLINKTLNLNHAASASGQNLIASSSPDAPPPSPLNIAPGVNLRLGDELPGFGVRPVSFSLANFRSLDATNSSYIGQIRAQFEFATQVIGNSRRPTVDLASVIIRLNAANTITSCESLSTEVTAASCRSMGCKQVGSNCQCPMRSFQCPTGELLMEIRNGVPICVPLGNGRACPYQHVMTSLAPGEMTCQRIPAAAATPAPSAVATPTPTPPPMTPTPFPTTPPSSGKCKLGSIIFRKVNTAVFDCTPGGPDLPQYKVFCNVWTEGSILDRNLDLNGGIGCLQYTCNPAKSIIYRKCE